MTEKIKFLHIGDTHLGFRQYGLVERFKDFNRVFKWILDKAIDLKVDFIIHTGDMFHHNDLNPETLTAVFNIISEFKRKSMDVLNREIPIFAIQGNHDQRGFLRLRSWMEFLADLDLIILLDGHFGSDRKSIDFSLYSKETKRGSMFSYKWMDIYGIPAYGSTTKDIFPFIYDSFSKKEKSDRFNLLMMHFGIEGLAKNKYGIKYSKDLELISEKVDYLALGHYHTYYKVPADEPWIFNPGSLEIVEMQEVYSGKERGALVVEVSKKPNNSFSISHQLYQYSWGPTSERYFIPNRAFINIVIDVGMSNLSTFAKTKKYILEYLTKHGIKKRDKIEDPDYSDLSVPIVSILLKGAISYSKLEFNLSELNNIVKDNFYILDVRINTIIESKMDGMKVSGDIAETIKDIEYSVFSSLITQNPQFEKHEDEIMGLVFDLKKMLTKKDVPTESMVELLKTWYSKNKSIIDEIEEESEDILEDLEKDENAKKIIMEVKKIVEGEEKEVESEEDLDLDFEPIEPDFD